MKYYIGVDLGGTAIKFGLFTEDGKLVSCNEISTRLENLGQYIIQDICDESKKLTAEANLSLSEISGIGIGIPGPIKNERDVIRCVNLGWGEIKVADQVESILQIPCKIGNDANIAALGESWRGAAKDTKSAVMITIGTGIGGGIIIDNKIVVGSHGGAGEIGHFPIADRVYNRTCGCGKQDCLETITSANGLVKNYRELTKGGNIEKNISAKDIFELAANNNKTAIEAIEQLYKLLGKACAFISCTVDPEVFVIGGGVSLAGDVLLDGIRKYYSEYAFPYMKNTKFVIAKLNNQAGIYGAARLVIKK